MQLCCCVHLRQLHVGISLLQSPSWASCDIKPTSQDHTSVAIRELPHMRPLFLLSCKGGMCDPGLCGCILFRVDLLFMYISHDWLLIVFFGIVV
jgi:hypothetical protein